MINRLARQLLQSDDQVGAILRFFQRVDIHLRTGQRNEREFPAERTGVLGALKSDQRLVQAARLPFAAVAPVAIVPVKRVGDIVASPILAVLILETAGADSRRVDQGQPQGLVVGLIGGEFAVFQHANAVAPIGVGQVEPLVVRHLVHVGIVRRALDRAETQIVGGFGITDGERKRGLEG